MHRVRWIALCIALGACESKKPDSVASTKPEPVTAPAIATSPGPIALPTMIPASAFLVIVVRMPESWLDMLTRLDPFPRASADLDNLRAELDDITRKRLGITLTSVSSATGYTLDERSFAVVIDGAVGEPKGKVVAPGIVALEGQSDVHATVIDGRLLIGTPAAVAAGVAAAGDPSKQLGARGEIADWFAEHTADATIAVALDGKRAPKAFARELGGVERGYATLGPTRIAMAIEADPKVLERFASVMNTAMTKGVADMDAAKKRALEGDDTFAAIAAVFGSYQARRMTTLVRPVVSGRKLDLELGLAMGDGTMFLAAAGIGAAIAIPGLTKYMRRSKTSEARVQIAKMFDAAAGYFNEEHVHRMKAKTGRMLEMAPHLCANDGRLSGTAGVTPPLALDCNAGPGGRCVPTSGGTGPGEYSQKLWTENPVWKALGFDQEQAHYFHYDFKWTNTNKGFGACQFTAQAFGDLDGDGVWSTFERSGAADQNGINAAAGMYIDQEVE